MIEFDTTPEELFVFCVQHIDDIEWNKLPNGEFTRNEIL